MHYYNKHVQDMYAVTYIKNERNQRPTSRQTYCPHGLEEHLIS